MPSVKVFTAVLAALAVPLAGASPCRPKVTTTATTSLTASTTETASSSTETASTGSTGSTGKGTDTTATSTTASETGSTTVSVSTTETQSSETQSSSTVSASASTTSSGACTYYTPLEPAPEDCGNLGFADDVEGKVIPSDSTANSAKDCGNLCGKTIGCASFSFNDYAVGTSPCTLYNVPRTQLGFYDDESTGSQKFYDLENCFGCGHETSSTTTGSSSTESASQSTTESVSTATATSSTETVSSSTETASASSSTETASSSTGTTTASTESTTGTTTASTESTTASTESTTASSTESTTASSTESTTASTESTTGTTTASSTESTTASSTETTTASTESTTGTTTASSTESTTGTTTASSTESTTASSTETTTASSTESTSTTAAPSTTTTEACSYYTPISPAPQGCGSHGTIDPDCDKHWLGNDFPTESRAKCGAECLSRAGCKSYSYYTYTGSCQLYDVPLGELNFKPCNYVTPRYYDIETCYECAPKPPATTTTAAPPSSTTGVCPKYTASFSQCERDANCGTRGYVKNGETIPGGDNDDLGACAKSCIQSGPICEFFMFTKKRGGKPAKCILYKGGQVKENNFKVDFFYEPKCFSCKWPKKNKKNSNNPGI